MALFGNHDEFKDTAPSLQILTIAIAWEGVRLNTVGTAEDLNRLRLELSEGTALVVTDSELETEAVATYSEDEKMWVAKIDPTKVRSLPPQS